MKIVLKAGSGPYTQWLLLLNGEQSDLSGTKLLIFFAFKIF